VFAVQVAALAGLLLVPGAVPGVQADLRTEITQVVALVALAVILALVALVALGQTGLIKLVVLEPLGQVVAGVVAGVAETAQDAADFWGVVALVAVSGYLAKVQTVLVALGAQALLLPALAVLVLVGHPGRQVALQTVAHMAAVEEELRVLVETGLLAQSVSFGAQPSQGLSRPPIQETYK
jgi:hypothetical protein